LPKFSASPWVLDVRRHLKCFASFFGRGDEPEKFARFAPQIFLAAPSDILQATRGPIRHSRKYGGATRRARGFPKIGHHWLPCRQPFEPMQGHRKILRPDVFAECKKCAMPSQILDCRFHPYVDLNLLNAGVALDVKNAVGNKQIVIKFLRTTNVQDCVRIAIELPDFF
jgi:hypothetical protein